MRIALFGPRGVLGKVLVARAGEHEIVPVYRTMYDFTSIENTAQCIESLQADAVINCSSVLPIKGSTALDMVLTNALFPHILVRAAQGLPIVLASTDRVFSGRASYRYTTGSPTSADDLFGKTCAVGEVLAPNVVVARSSYISPEHGFLRWLLNNRGKEVSGWTNSHWSGSTVDEVALAMLALLESGRIGIQHLSTLKSISKYDLGCKLIDYFELDVKMNPAFTSPMLNYSLQPTVILPPIDEVLRNGFWHTGNCLTNGKAAELCTENTDEGTTELASA